MPLVVPQADSGDKTSQWQHKLLGKRIGDSHDEQTFAKKDLPEQHRILRPDSMSTMDIQPERLNVHVNDDGTVHKVSHG